MVKNSVEMKCPGHDGDVHFAPECRHHRVSMLSANDRTLAVQCVVQALPTAAVARRCHRMGTPVQEKEERDDGECTFRSPFGFIVCVALFYCVVFEPRRHQYRLVSVAWPAALDT